MQRHLRITGSTGEYVTIEVANRDEMLRYAAMLKVAIYRCQQESIHMLEVIGLTPELERKLERLSPHRRLLPTWMYFYKPNNRSLAETLKNTAVWEPSLFDGDSSLCSLTVM